MTVLNLAVPQVINTRPAPMGLELEASLAQHQIKSVYQPALENKLIPNAAASFNFSDTFDSILIFVSRPAVDAFFQHIKTKPDVIAALKNHKNMIAVGKGTAKQLSEHLLIDIKKIITPDQTDSEGVLSLPLLQGARVTPFNTKAKPASKTVHIFKGIGGRQLIKSSLEDRGFEVCEWSLYERIAIQYPQASSAWAQAKVIIVTSKDVAHSILDSLKLAEDSDLNHWLWIAFSARIKHELISLGINKSNIYTCEQMDNSSIIHMIQAIKLD